MKLGGGYIQKILLFCSESLFSVFCLRTLRLSYTRIWLHALTHTDVKLGLSPSQKNVRRHIQKFSDWPPGVRTANGRALCHQLQLYRYFVSQSSEFCRHYYLCCFSTSNTKGKRIFRYRLSPETFGYTHICSSVLGFFFFLTKLLDLGNMSFLVVIHGISFISTDDS